MQVRYYLAASAAALSIASFSAPLFAQSTGSVDFEEEIVVTGTTGPRQVEGVVSPDSSKAKAVLTQEIIENQNPGQTILDTINLIPGVSFQNNDAYGSSGGTLNIRGFTADRVSLTVDGIPLNDSGNYAVYSNQQFDPELIGEVNVNLGTTDVDSPTASAAGGTVNYRTIVPGEDIGAKLSASHGDFDFFRVFGMIETGNLTSIGTRAFVSASKATNDNPFNNYGKVNKQQYNAKLYQPVGDNGDFVSIAGHYNQNRNNFFGSLPLRNDQSRTITLNGVSTIVPRIVGGLSQNRFPADKSERKYLLNFPCSIDTAEAGVADSPARSLRPDGSADVNSDYGSCGTEFDRRYNPSNTGNVRVASKMTVGDFTFTIDPSYQYVKANGGGTVTGNEGAVRDINPAGRTATPAECRADPSSATNSCVAGYLGGVPYFGRDINGDGDTLDTLTVLAPSQTQTHRYLVIAGVRYDISENQAIRVGYTFDRARHRQTGEVGLVGAAGEPLDVFPVNDPLADVTDTNLQKRDRLSYAILNQFWGEYRGEFLDGALTVNAGVRAPFFRRELNNYCFTSSSGGFVDCFGKNNSRNGQYAALNPDVQGPQKRVFKYDKVLPNVGLVFDVTPDLSLFGNFSQGLSVPGTDNLYNSFFFAADTPEAQPRPEKTNNYDLGVRYSSGNVQAQLGAFYNQYKDRQASAFDPELNTTVYRNLGKVEKYGLDGYISFKPIPEISLYAFGSYLKSEIKDNLVVGECSAAQVTAGFPGCTTADAPIFALTSGKREAGSPKYTYGGTIRGNLGDFEVGVTGKRTGERYIYDTNEAVRAFVNGVDTEVYDNKAPAYWLVNLDARYSLAAAGLEKTYVQLNVYNLFNDFYVGGFGGGLNQTVTRNTAGVATSYGNPPNVQIGAPRTISATLVVGF